MKIKIPQAIECVKKTFKARLVPFLHGSPGIGKSAIMKKLAQDYRLFLIDLRLSQMEPTDLAGFPQIDMARRKAGYVPMDTFPLAGEELPFYLDASGQKIPVLNQDGSPKIDAHGQPEYQRYNGWLLFFDEANSCPKAVQAASYKIVLDRMVGQSHLHAMCFMAMAGNLENDGAIVEPMSTALQSRLVHFELENPRDDAKPWLDWASDRNLDHRITAFINYKPGLVNNFSPDHTDFTYSCGRTLEMAHNLLQTVEPNDWQGVKNAQGQTVAEPNALVMLAGALGEGVAREFVTFTKVYDKLPSMNQIVLNPEGTPVPDEIDVQWALTGTIAHHATVDNIEHLLKYVKRMPIEYQVVCLRDAKRRKPQLTKSTAFQNWVMGSAMDLF